MAGEIFEKFFDPEAKDTYWADLEPKSTKNLQKIFSEEMSTKDELKIVESSLKTWNDEELPTDRAD